MLKCSTHYCAKHGKRAAKKEDKNFVITVGNAVRRVKRGGMMKNVHFLEMFFFPFLIEVCFNSHKIMRTKRQKSNQLLFISSVSILAKFSSLFFYVVPDDRLLVPESGRSKCRYEAEKN